MHTAQCHSADQLLREGAVSMQNQDENIRVLELETREIQRQIDLLRKQVPDKANIESSLVNSQIEVYYWKFD